MVWPVPTFQEIITSELRDIANQNPDAYIGLDGDYAIRAAAHAAAVEGLYAYQNWIYKQTFPDLMDFDTLQLFGADRGVYLRTATSATGILTFSGTAGAAVPLGTNASLNGTAFITTATAVIGTGGTVAVACQAVIPGSAGNLLSSSVLALSSAPAGIHLTATLSSANLDGTDTESKQAYLTRVLYRLQNPPQGGSAADYYIWATNTPGCGNAYIYGQRTFPNSVDIVILDANGHLPTSGLISAVQANINLNRPVCANNSVVCGPASVSVPVTATLALAIGANLSVVSSLINTALAAYFATLTPGQSVVYNDLVSLVMSTDGVTDVHFTTPTANVSVTLDNTTIQLAKLGTVTIS